MFLEPFHVPFYLALDFTLIDVAFGVHVHTEVRFDVAAVEVIYF